MRNNRGTNLEVLQVEYLVSTNPDLYEHNNDV